MAGVGKTRYNGRMNGSIDAFQVELLSGLNEPQRQAVSHTEGPLLILAGPGSGKTRVVTRRAAYLAATVTKPWHILAITFTNKAASEMRERIESLDVAAGMTVCTFHALCARLLRRYHDRVNLPRNFTIFDQSDRRKVIKKAIEVCDLSTTNWSPAGIEPVISRAKNELLRPRAFAETAIDFHSKTVARIYEQYDRMMRQMAGLDFDDLLMNIALLLTDDTEVRAELEDRFRYVLIDEYQDTNAAQYRIARRLADGHRNICATGDPDQSIYGWRGADISNILNFEKDYPEAKVVRLEQNYRSTGRILSAAGALISRNTERKEKRLWTENEAGPDVRVIECESGDEEADRIAQDIAKQQRNGLKLSDTAVLYRVNSLSRSIEERFIREGLPYQIARGVAFYNRKEIKDVLAYLRVLVNPADDVSLTRIINTPPRGIGQTTVQRLISWAESTGQSLHSVATGGGDLSELGRSAAKVGEFGKMLVQLASVMDQPVHAALEYVSKHSGLRALYSAMDDGDDAPINNINELVSAAVEFESQNEGATIGDWLEHTALLGDVDSVRDDSGMVTLMTLHAAKGLEFDNVYIIGLEEGLIPFVRGHEDGDEEEERRLLFVGMTRARRGLVLLHARYRMMRGVTERTIQSSFLDELPVDEVEWQAERTVVSPRRSRATDHGKLPDDVEQWEVGTLVEHERYGIGRIMSIQRGHRRTHLEVMFRDGSRHRWVLEFAALKRVAFEDVGDL